MNRKVSLIVLSLFLTVIISSCGLFGGSSRGNSSRGGSSSGGSSSSGGPVDFGDQTVFQNDYIAMKANSVRIKKGDSKKVILSLRVKNKTRKDLKIAFYYVKYGANRATLVGNDGSESGHCTIKGIKEITSGYYGFSSEKNYSTMSASAITNVTIVIKFKEKVTDKSFSFTAPMSVHLGGKESVQFSAGLSGIKRK